MKIIEEFAFTEVEFGKLETIERAVFSGCSSLRHLHIPSIRSIEENAFYNCISLTDVEFGKGLESIGRCAFDNCYSLRRIAIPLKLKDNMFTFDEYYERYTTQFDRCDKLTTVDLIVGVIHKTIFYLSLQSWRNEMDEEINRINQVLPNTPDFTEKTKDGGDKGRIQSVLRQIERYKSEHHSLLKVATTILELALWKANLERESGGGALVETKAKKAKIDVESARQERRTTYTCGADIITKNVLPFVVLP